MTKNTTMKTAAAPSRRRDVKGRTVLEQISELSAAEDFFVYFLLPFEQEIVSVNRLHVMKRMGQYMSEFDVETMSEDEIFLAGRTALKRAYADFLASTPLEEKVFKVFTDQEKALQDSFVNIDVTLLAAE